MANLSWDSELVTDQGKDFLFLFDLLSHTSGIEATLRVLTHADDTFRRICLPKVSSRSSSTCFCSSTSSTFARRTCGLRRTS